MEPTPTITVPRAAAHRRSAVLLTALDIATKAVLRHLTRREERTIDGTVFYLGRFEDWDIAVAEAGPGNASAAAIAERAIANFRPRTIPPMLLARADEVIE